MNKTIVRSLLFAFAGVLAASTPAGEARRAPDAVPVAADRFKTVFSWGCVTDEETARAYAEKCQYGGEPVTDGDLCPEPIPCFLGDTNCAASFAALAKTLAENPGADGIALDYIGYTNLRSCECDGCKAHLAAWLKERWLEENEANRDRFFREGLVGYVNALVAEAKRIRPGIRVAIHLYPVFLPDPLYGRDLTADCVQETAAWYFPWPEEKIADYTRKIVSAERLPGSVGVPFVGLNATPGMPLEVKSPERLEAELGLILANGGDRLAVCGGDDMLKPGYREVFAKYTRGGGASPAAAGRARGDHDVCSKKGTPCRNN